MSMRTSGSAEAVSILSIICVLGVPIAVLVACAFRGPADYLPFEDGAQWTFDNFRTFYLDANLYTDVLPNTFLFALGSVAISFLVGLLFAWIFVRCEFRAKRVLGVLLLAPLLMPASASALVWIKIFGPNAGLANQVIRALDGEWGASGPFDIFSFAGLIWCQSIASVPFAYLLLLPAVRSVSLEAEDAALVSGAKPSAVFLRITVPQILPSLLSALLLLFLISIELVEFPYLIGTAAQINVLGTRILLEISAPSGLPNLGAASAAAMLLLIISLLGLWLLGAATKMTGKFQSGNVRPVSGISRRSILQKFGVCILWCYIAFAVCMPLLTLIGSSLEFSWPWIPGSINGMSLESYERIFARDDFWMALRNTLIVSTAAAVVTTTLGLLVTFSTFEGLSWRSRLLDKISIVSIGIPSLVVASGAIVLYLLVPIGVYGTTWILILAYSYRIALPVRLSKAALSQLHPSLTEAASMSGAGWWSTRLRVSIPLMRPAILSTLTLMIVVAAREFTIPLMLYSPENVVLPVFITQLYQSGRYADSASAAIVLMLSCSILIYLFHLALRLGDVVARSPDATNRRDF